jgi:hypothetical protein
MRFIRAYLIYHPRAVPRPLLIVLLVLASVAAIGPGCAGPSGSRTVGFVTLVGVDHVLSLNVQGTMLPIEGRSEIVDQLDRLVDARIAVVGTVGSRVVVRSFELLEAPDGLVPYLGRLVYDQTGVRLYDETTGTRIVLRSTDLDRLKRHHGDRVWITGSIVGPQTLLIAHWGVIVPSSP